MTPEDYLDSKEVDIRGGGRIALDVYVTSNDAYEAVDMAKRQIAQSIIDRYNDGTLKDLSGVLNYCYGIVDF